MLYEHTPTKYAYALAPILYILITLLYSYCKGHNSDPFIYVYIYIVLDGVYAGRSGAGQLYRGDEGAVRQRM